MLTFVLGPSGSGKTNWLIQEANKEKQSGNGNIAFIDSDDSHIFSLDHKIRLINAKNFDVSDVHQFYGFIAGIISRDYDIQKIFVDGIYEIVDVHGQLQELVEALDKLSKNNNVDILMGLDIEKTQLPQTLEYEVVELQDSQG